MSSYVLNKWVILALGVLLVLVGCQGKTTAPTAPTIQPPVTGEATLQIIPAKDKPALEIWVDQVSNLYAVDMQLRFAPAKLQITDADPNKEGVQIQTGQAPTADFVVTNEVNLQDGTIRYVATQIAPRPGFNGKGLLGTIILQATPPSDATVSIEKITLVSKEGQPIEVKNLESK